MQPTTRNLINMGKHSRGICLPANWINQREKEANGELTTVKVTEQGNSLVIETCVFAQQEQSIQPEPQVEAIKTKIICECGTTFDSNREWCRHAMEMGHRDFKET